MKSLLLKFIIIFFAILAILVLISLAVKIIPYFNVSALFNNTPNFAQRLLIFIPFTLAITILIIFAIFYKDDTSPLGVLVGFFIILVLSFILLDFVLPKSPKLENNQLERLISRRQSISNSDIKNVYKKLRKELNASLDIIYFEGDYTKAKNKLIEINKNYSVGRFLSSQILVLVKIREKQEKLFVKRAMRTDPDFKRGYNHLKNKRFVYAERYFRSNLSPNNKYFLVKSTALLQRQGELNLETKFQNLRRKRQLIEIGKKVKLRHNNSTELLYKFYKELYLTYGIYGLTNEYTTYARIISANEITDHDIRSLKYRQVQNHVTYLTSIIIKNREKKFKLNDVLLFVKSAYYSEGSELVYFKNARLITMKGKEYTIDIARIDGQIGIFQNLTGNSVVLHKGSIQIGKNAKSIIQFQSIYPIGKTLSTYTLLKTSKTSITYKLFKPILSEKLSYYTGIIFLLIISILFGLLISVRKYKKINTLLWILPLIITIIFAFIMTNLSFFLSRNFIKLLL